MGKKRLAKMLRNLFVALVGNNGGILMGAPWSAFTQVSSVSKAIMAGRGGWMVWPAEAARV